MIKIILFDDNRSICDSIGLLLSTIDDMRLVATYHNVEDVIDRVRKANPDVILMDINLPDKSGIDLCKEVREKYPSVFIIGLSTFNQQSFIQKMMDNGASGYVLKNASQKELMEAITTVAKGKSFLSDEASQALRKDESFHIVLTRREKEVLELIAEGMTNAEIAKQLFIGVTTVDTHRKNLLAKFEAKNTASLVRIASQLHLI